MMMVRYAKREELTRVNELRKQVNDLHCEGRPDLFRPGFSQELRDYVYAIFNSENKDIVVAEIDGIICGFACIQYVEKPETPYRFALHFCDIDELCVDQAFRRLGIAKAIIAFIKEEAKKKGFNRLELNMWSFNEDALRFYEAVGFSTYRRYMEMQL